MTIGATRPLVPGPPRTCAEMMEGPNTLRLDGVELRQVGWLCFPTAIFVPWPDVPTREQAPGSYSPVYMEVGE